MVLTEEEIVESITKPIKKFLFLISILSFVGVFVLLALTTSPLEDFPFFFAQIQYQFLFADLVSLLLGFIGVLYYFIFPGIVYILTLNPLGLQINPKRLIMVLVYSSTGNYFILLFGMIINVPILGLIAPLILFCIMLFAVYILNLIEAPIEPTQILQLSRSGIRKIGNPLWIASILVVGFSIIIRMIMFNANVIEFSDVVDYDLQITSISANDFLLNPYFSARAPLYAMFAYLFSFFVPTYLTSLKITSFMFSFLLLIPAYSIINSLQEGRGNEKTHITVITLLSVYPWIMLMASVALQDILLVFYVMTFLALILHQDRKMKILSAIPAGFAFLCRYSLGILGPMGFLYIIFRTQKEKIKTSVLFGLSWCIILVSWIIRNIVVAGVLFSTTDEGLFDASHFIPGLVNIAKELVLDRIGMNTLVLWIPIGIVGLLFLRTRDGRKIIKQFLTIDYIFIFLIIIGQLLVIASFRTQQYRFLLSAIWLIPIFWVILSERFRIPASLLLSLGWVIFSIGQAFHLNRIYWVFDMGRLPAGRYENFHRVIETTMPTISNWTNIAIAMIAMTVLVLFLRMAFQNYSRSGS